MACICLLAQFMILEIQVFFFHMSSFHLPTSEVLLFCLNDRLMFSMTSNVTMLQGLTGRKANKNIL